MTSGRRQIPEMKNDAAFSPNAAEIPPNPATNAPYAGPKKALTVLKRALMTYTCQTWRRPAQARTTRIVISRPRSKSDINMTRTRENLSAVTPPTSVNRIVGMNALMKTPLMATAELVVWTTHHAKAA